MNLALKDIQHNLGRFILTTIGIGMLLMVVMGMGGIYRGIEDDALLLINNIKADIWVVQRDTRGPFAEVSRIPSNMVYRTEAVPGVQSAREFVFHTIQREWKKKTVRIAILGLSWPNDKGEWLPLIAGRMLSQNHYEMIADQSLGMNLGEKIALGKETYTVVGITKGMMNPTGDGMSFFTVLDAQAIQQDISGEAIRLERAARRTRAEKFEVGIKQPGLLSMASRPSRELPGTTRNQISAVMLNLKPGVDPKQVIKTISGWGDVTTYSKQDQEMFLIEGMVSKVRQQIGLFRILLTLIAAIIMALILYTNTLEKIHSIALLKLIGAPNRTIFSLIVQQALLLGVLGFGVGYFVGQRIFPMFPRRVLLTNADLIQLAIIVIIISFISSLLGVRKALSVSPNEALS